MADAALTDIEVVEVSVVPFGANGKVFALRKSDEEDAPMPDMDTILKASLDLPLENEKHIDYRLRKSGIETRLQPTLKGVVRILQSQRDLLDDSHIAMLAELAGYGNVAASKSQEPTKPTENIESPPKADASEEGQPVEKSESKAEGVSIDVEKRFEEQHARIEKAQAENVELKKALEAERNARVMRECVEKAGKEFPMLGAAKDIGATIKKLQDAGLYEDIEPLLKAANEKANRAELFQEQSRPGHASTEHDPLRKAADGLREKNPNLTLAAAMDLALMKDPNLYTQAKEG